MVPRSISPTMASCEISSAISGSRKIVRLERLTITTSSGAHADVARRRAAEEGEREGERRQQQGRGENPAVAQALLDLLARDDQDVSHRAASCDRRKWA